MMPANPGKVVCPSCGEESFFKRVPRYDGFKKIGESLKCAACGHEFAAESEVPKPRAKPAIFDESDAPRTVQVFQDDEKGRFCRYCRHFVVNPFTQRCGRNQKTVEATDSCTDFEAR